MEFSYCGNVDWVGHLKRAGAKDLLDNPAYSLKTLAEELRFGLYEIDLINLPEMLASVKRDLKQAFDGNSQKLGS